MFVFLSTWSDVGRMKDIKMSVTPLFGRAELLESETVVIHCMGRHSDTVGLNNARGIVSHVCKDGTVPWQLPSLTAETRLS